eukprot:SAG31_NODE_2541_length_5536_cov_2.014162_2_plen_152_part_00
MRAERKCCGRRVLFQPTLAPTCEISQLCMRNCPVAFPRHSALSRTQAGRRERRPTGSPGDQQFPGSVGICCKCLPVSLCNFSSHPDRVPHPVQRLDPMASHYSRRAYMPRAAVKRMQLRLKCTKSLLLRFPLRSNTSPMRGGIQVTSCAHG